MNKYIEYRHGDLIWFVDKNNTTKTNISNNQERILQVLEELDELLLYYDSGANGYEYKLAEFLYNLLINADSERHTFNLDLSIEDPDVHPHNRQRSHIIISMNNINKDYLFNTKITDFNYRITIRNYEVYYDKNNNQRYRDLSYYNFNINLNN